MKHLLYDDEVLVAKVTGEHLAAGRSVLQMFQASGGERRHSGLVLSLLNLPRKARVLSLGCGVGGMERYWQDSRPDLSFELVNISQAQLDRCLCDGRKVRADIEHYDSEHKPFDCTVLAYVLGHVPVLHTIDVAKLHTKPAGIVVVLDVFNGTQRFDDAMAYATPTVGEMRAAGMVRMLGAHELKLTRYFADHAVWVRYHVTPGMYTCAGTYE